MSLQTLARDSRGARAAGGAWTGTAFRLALAAYAGLAAYCLLSILVGPAGLGAYSRLEGRVAAMEANLVVLGGVREGLNAELESLKIDPDRAAREARSLGYLRKGEGALILAGRAEPRQRLESGAVLPFAQPVAVSDAVLKEISLGLFLAILALLLSPRGRRGRDS
jgi:cell division protein FtsB